MEAAGQGLQATRWTYTRAHRAPPESVPGPISKPGKVPRRSTCRANRTICFANWKPERNETLSFRGRLSREGRPLLVCPGRGDPVSATLRTKGEGEGGSPFAHGYQRRYRSSRGAQHVQRL